MTADEIHKLGLEEVKRIETEMLAVMREAGFTGSVVEFGRHIASLPEQHFHDKDEMLAYCRKYREDYRARVAQPFSDHAPASVRDQGHPGGPRSGHSIQRPAAITGLLLPGMV
jgi:uncharacterized protein (DUF885 family)